MSINKRFKNYFIATFYLFTFHGCVICIRNTANWNNFPSSYYKYFINRPGIARAVLQSPPWFIHSLINWVIRLLKYLPNTLNPKPEELENWNFERMFISHYVWYVMCDVSFVTCHMSPVTCHLSPGTCHLSPVTYKNNFFFTFFLFKKRK